MIFIWSSNGGPIQHAVMLILFLVQLLPFLLNNEASFEHTTSTSVPPNRHNTGSNSIISNTNSRSTRTTTYRYSASYTVSTDDLPWKTLALTFLVFFIVIFSLLAVGLDQYRVWLRSRYENMAQNIEERQAREMQEEPERQPAPNQPDGDDDDDDDAYYDRSSRYWLITVFLFGLVSGLFAWGAFNEDLSDIAIFVGSFLQFAGFVWMMTRSFADAHQEVNNNNNNNNINRENPARLASIVSKIRKLPVEEFLPNDEETYSKLKISELKQMLQSRGDTASSYLEKHEMVAALCQNRKYDESCCICYENYYCHCHYSEDDDDDNDKIDIIRLRILPKCGHEFHLQCLDQWAYTFERKSEEPSCPLCKTEF